MVVASASGKVILCGEHAVVYGRPAIAVPVSDVRATAKVTPSDAGSGIVVEARDLGQTFRLGEPHESDTAHALLTTVRNTLEHLGIPPEGQDLHISVRSQIPIARGMGSGTAVVTAMVRALAQYYDRHLTARAVSDLVYRTEIILHGTPSGIDNTVVAFEKPVYFIKDRCADIFWIAHPFTLLIADTGIPSKTRDAVVEVRRRWQANPTDYEALFDEIGATVERARQAMMDGELGTLGHLMTQNQRLLQELGVSCPELERLVDAALDAGALGAKLSGGGQGGCMIALVEQKSIYAVTRSLSAAGSRSVIATNVR